MIIQGKGEFNILNNSFNSDPSDIIINKESKPECRKRCQFVNNLNIVTIKFDTQIQSYSNMFDGIINIAEIDLSNFDSSNVMSMHSMFTYCANLKKITFGNINTCLVQNIEKLFYFCENLIIIDRLNFDTSSVKTMKRMFSNCDLYYQQMYNLLLKMMKICMICLLIAIKQQQ